MNTAELIVQDFIDEITNRRGLRHEWDNIDIDIQQEILADLVALVQKRLDAE